MTPLLLASAPSPEAKSVHCATQVAAHSETDPPAETSRIPSSLRGWAIAATAACGVGAAGVYGCYLVYESPEIRRTFVGMMLALGAAKALSLSKRAIAPQYEYLQQWLDRSGYSLNGWVLQFLFGRRHHSGALGDNHSPDIYRHINGRFTDWQAWTASKIETVAKSINENGMWILRLLEEDKVTEAAAQLAAVATNVSYYHLETLRVTQDAKYAEVRALILAPIDQIFIRQLKAHFRFRPGRQQHFQKEVERALQYSLSKYPTLKHYSEGIEIVLNDWFSELFKSEKTEEPWNFSLSPLPVTLSIQPDNSVAKPK